MSIRQATILGRAGSAADVNETGDGTKVASVSVATENYHDDEAVWVSVTAFGGSAKYLAKAVDKGDYVYASGTLELDEWGDNAQLKVIADKLKVMNKGGSSGGTVTSGGGGDNYESPPEESLDDSEIPFRSDPSAHDNPAIPMV